MEATLILDMVVTERQQQPRIGVKKLYHIYNKDIHQVAPHLGRDKFYDLLRENDLLVLRKRSFTRTTNSYHRFHKYGNMLKGCVITRPNQAWVSDITYLRTRQGFVYLSLLTDYYSRKIVGWNLSRSLGIEGSLASLQRALKSCRETKDLIHHSDRGVQYCSNPYTELLHKNGMQISMTQENHCYENAMAERVNGILKDEYLLDSTFYDYRQAEQACKQAIVLYNTRRPHLALNLRTPEVVHNMAA
jgi:transposase InsO family protein